MDLTNMENVVEIFNQLSSSRKRNSHFDDCRSLTKGANVVKFSITQIDK
jgi:hypothetical protein